MAKLFLMDWWPILYPQSIVLPMPSADVCVYFSFDSQCPNFIALSRISPGRCLYLGLAACRDGAAIAKEASEVDALLDATGLTLLPGAIDPQVIREPGLEHKEDLFTATCACAKGGVTFSSGNAQ